MNIYLAPKSTTWLAHSAEQREMHLANIKGQTFASLISLRSARLLHKSGAMARKNELSFPRF